MDVTPLIPEGRQIIQGYSAAGFKISGKLYDSAVIVTPVESWNWNAPDAFSALDISCFDDLVKIADDLDVVLIGSGTKGEFLAPALRSALKDRGLIVDVMDSGAACRTYNVLMAEGRRIAAALMPVK